jgi:hypothetical protein
MGGEGNMEGGVEEVEVEGFACRDKARAARRLDSCRIAEWSRDSTGTTVGGAAGRFKMPGG